MPPKKATKPAAAAPKKKTGGCDKANVCDVFGPDYVQKQKCIETVCGKKTGGGKKTKKSA